MSNASPLSVLSAGEGNAEIHGEVAVVYPLLECNARCPFCSSRVYTERGVVSVTDHQNGTYRPMKDYSTPKEEMFAIYRGLKAKGVKRINLQGGEPTLLPYLFELLDYGRELAFDEQFVITNGRRFADRDFAERMLHSAADGAGFSMYGASPEVHDESLGVKRAFDDMRVAARNLRELGAFHIDSPFHCAAQLIVHGRNVHELPAMMRLVHEEGFRSIGLRLLRETANTQAGGVDWFFDLAKLKAPLEECLDYALSHRELFVSFSELFYCLVDPEFLGLVWTDRATNPGLRQEKFVVSRRTEAAHGGFARRHEWLRANGVHDCDACDLRHDCAPLEHQYFPHYSGRLRPIRLAERVTELAGRALDDRNFARLSHLVDQQQELVEAGAPAASLVTLRSRLVRYALASSPPRHDEARALAFAHDDAHAAREAVSRLRGDRRPPKLVELSATDAAAAERVAEGPLFSLFRDGDRLAFTRHDASVERDFVETALASLATEPGGLDLAVLRARFAAAEVGSPADRLALVGYDHDLGLAFVGEARRLDLRARTLAESSDGPLPSLLFEDQPAGEFVGALARARRRGTPATLRFVPFDSELPAAGRSITATPPLFRAQWDEQPAKPLEVTIAHDSRIDQPVLERWLRRLEELDPDLAHAQAPARAAMPNAPGRRPSGGPMVPNPGELRARFELLAANPTAPETWGELRGLLRNDDLLASVGVDANTRRSVRRRLVAHAAPPDSPAFDELADLLFSQDIQTKLRDELLFGKSRRRPPLVVFRDRAPADSDTLATLADRTDEERALASSLVDAHRVAAGEGFALFAGWEKSEAAASGVRSTDRLVIAVAFDPELFTVAGLERLFDRLTSPDPRRP